MAAIKQIIPITDFSRVTTPLNGIKIFGSTKASGVQLNEYMEHSIIIPKYSGYKVSNATLLFRLESYNDIESSNEYSVGNSSQKIRNVIKILDKTIIKEGPYKVGVMEDISISLSNYNGEQINFSMRTGADNGGDEYLTKLFYFNSSIEAYDDFAGFARSYIRNMRLELEINFPDSSITNLTTVGDLWEKDISVNWRSENQDGYEYELYYNNVLIKNGAGLTDKNFVIAGNTFKGTMPASVRVRVYNTLPDGTKNYSSWSEKPINLKNIEATISNLIIDGEYWEKPIYLSWRSENQQQFSIEILKDNVVVKTYTGTTSNGYTISANELINGSHNIRVTVAYANRYVNSTERSIALKDLQATVKDLSLSGSSIDLPLTFSWVSTDQQFYEYEIYKDTTKVKNGSGTTSTSISIVNNELTTGLHKFKVRVAYKDRWTNWEEINVNLVETLPSIGVLEPDGVIVDKDYPTRIWWTSQNQSTWKITLDGGTPIAGTWQTEYIIPGGVLQTGKHTLNLIVTYVTSAGVEKQAFKNAEFIVQGKPPIPTFTNSNAFTTSRPTLSWDTQDQQGYLLEILKDDVLVWTTEWQNGLVTRQKVLTYLPNGTYVAKLKIINQFSIESDYGKMTFTVNANESMPITLNANKQGNTVSLSWDNIDYKFDKFYIIRNGEVIGKTTDTIYIDYTTFGSCSYVVRGINQSDIYKDSNIATVDFVVDYSAIATVDALNDMLNVSLSKAQYGFEGSLEIASSTMHMHGRVLPVTIFGAHETNTFNIAFNQKDLCKFKEMFRRRQTLCYRDKREKLFLSISNPSYNIDATGYNISVQATETDYIEVIDYD